MTHRRLLALLPLMTGLVVLPGLAHAQDQSGDNSAPPPSTVPDDPFGLPDADLVDGGIPLSDPASGVVHRWTITPEGANDPNAVSTRSELAYTGEPGSVIEDAVTVFNLGNQPLTFEIYGTDAINDPDGAFALLSRASEPTDVGTWVTMQQANITISPGMASTIPITVTIPDDARPGDHVGAVVASSSVEGVTADGSRIELDRGVGTRLYVRVAGPLQPELSVENLSVTHQPGANPLGGRTTVTYRVHNTGNVRLSGTYQSAAEGPFGVGREDGETIAFTDLLPDQSIDVVAEFNDSPSLGWVGADVTVESEGAAGADSGDTAAATAVALPVTLLLVVLLLIAAWLASRAIRRHRRADHELVLEESRPEPEHQLS